MKKLFSLAAIAFCLSLTSKAQYSIFLVADNIKTGSSTTPSSSSNLTDVFSIGNSIACGGCSVSPGPTTVGRSLPGKIILNIKNDQVLMTLKTMLVRGIANAGNAYLIFSKTSGTGTRAATPGSDYYYIKLSNYTVMEIDESGSSEGNSVQVSLGYSALNWTVKPQSPTTGALGNPISYGWDFAKNVESTSSAVPPTSLGSF